MRLPGEGKTHHVLLASVAFPSMGGLYHLARPPAMSENGVGASLTGRSVMPGKMHQREDGEQTDVHAFVCGMFSVCG